MKLFEEYMKVLELSKKTNLKTVVFYGGSSLDENTKIYQDIHSLAQSFAELGYGVITGGGSGIMKAAATGAAQIKNSQVISYQMKKIDEDKIALLKNPNNLQFENFAPRKQALRQADIYIFCPGGLGTLDELMENLNLIKTGKIKNRKIYLYSTVYWSGLLKWLEIVTIQKWHLANPNILSLFKVVDDQESILKDLNEPF